LGCKKYSKTQIIVTTAIEGFSTQVFTFGQKEIEKDEDNWMQLVRKYYDIQQAKVKGG